MKPVQVLAALCVLSSVSVARADVFLTFEDLPIVYNADYGAIFGDIANHYSPYVTFGQNVQGTGGTSFLPVIGNVGLENVYDGLFVYSGPYTINFSTAGALAKANAGIKGISFWYSSLSSITVSTYDANNVLISQNTAPANTSLYNPGGPSYFSLSGANIASVVIDDGSGFGGSLVIDDLNFSSSNVPDATGTLGLLGMAGIGLLAFRRKISAT